jgi:transposase
MKGDTLFVENRRLKEQLGDALCDLSSKVSLLEEKDKKIKEQNKTIKEKEAIIQDLSSKISVLEILHFGAKSEKWTSYDKLQARLFNEAEDDAFKQNDAAKQQSVIETIELGSYTRRKRKPQGQGRKPISPDLPREDVVFDIDESEKICACGCEKTMIGAEISERVKIIPAAVTVLREKRLKYACKNCEGTEADEPGVVTATGTKHLIPGSIADESLIAWSITEKFAFALPLYRQSLRLKYIGLPIPRATLSNIVIKAAMKCSALYELLKEHIKSWRYINADETRVQVLKEPGRKAQSLSWMWVFLGGPPGKKAVVFQYDKSRSSEVPKEFFKDYSGWLQTDDYSSYNAALKVLNKDRPLEKKIRHILCWQHARSMFFKSWKASKSEYAEKAIEYIGDLFALEKLRTRYSEKGFYKQRKNRAEQIFEEFKSWLEKLYPETPPGNLLGKAITYTLDNWELLILYIEDPILTPSNNLAENIIRPFVIGRKNWLFCNTPNGANASAILYSFIESAKLNNLVPYDYLYYIFRKLPYAETKQDYIDLLPFNLTPEKIRGK